MRKLSLQEIKQIEFNILISFKKFCEENEINYFLSNGTLLGAVKYKGFIPWDDDIDVFVPREDYNKLILRYKDMGNYKLFSTERNEKFGFPFAKLCDMSTIKEEIGLNNGSVLGLDIDIFPLDSWDANDPKKQLGTTKRYMSYLIWSKIGFSKGRTPVRTVIKNFLVALFHIMGAGNICKKIQKNVLNGNLKSSDKKGCAVWPVYGEREIIPAEVFINTVEVEFEGEKFPAPIGYDVYLKSLYGDYRKDPPLEEQKTHHSYKAYKID